MYPTGYLINRKEGLFGTRGDYYDYVLAGNGLFVEAEGRLMAARVKVAPAEVRGLAPMDERLVLRYGNIPGVLFNLLLNSWEYSRCLI